MKVDVYFNLHKKVWSVRCVKTRKVVLHTTELTLSDVTFKVSQAGRERVIREKRKNVHAVVRGVLQRWESGNVTEHGASLGVDNWHERRTAFFRCSSQVRFTYNPYKFKSFMAASLRNPDEFFPVDGATGAVFTPRYVYLAAPAGTTGTMRTII